MDCASRFVHGGREPSVVGLDQAADVGIKVEIAVFTCAEYGLFYVEELVC